MISRSKGGGIFTQNPVYSRLRFLEFTGLRLKDSTIQYNSAHIGGGIKVEGVPTSQTGTVISHNRAYLDFEYGMNEIYGCIWGEFELSDELCSSCP